MKKRKTCSEQAPTITTSCKDKVIIGDFSTGGVINGFNLQTTHHQKAQLFIWGSDNLEEKNAEPRPKMPILGQKC